MVSHDPHQDLVVTQTEPFADGSGVGGVPHVELEAARASERSPQPAFGGTEHRLAAFGVTERQQTLQVMAGFFLELQLCIGAFKPLQEFHVDKNRPRS